MQHNLDSDAMIRARLGVTRVDKGTCTLTREITRHHHYKVGSGRHKQTERLPRWRGINEPR